MSSSDENRGEALYHPSHGHRKPWLAQRGEPLLTPSSVAVASYADIRGNIGGQAYSVYRWYTQAEEEEDCNVTSAGAAADGDKGWSVENAQSVSRPPSFVEDVPRPAYARQGSFQVTDEMAQLVPSTMFGASQWSWLVDKESRKKQRQAASRREAWA